MTEILLGHALLLRFDPKLRDATLTQRERAFEDGSYSTSWVAASRGIRRPCSKTEHSKSKFSGVVNTTSQLPGSAQRTQRM
jgi:hypothetical protein